MDFDQYLLWLVDSLQCSIKDDTIDETKLIKNVDSIFIRVKQQGNENAFEDFRNRATLVLLLCWPRIRELAPVASSQDFQHVISATPILTESQILSLMKNQKIYRCLPHIICYLEPSNIQVLIKEYFKDVVVNPITLAMSLELFKAYIICLQRSQSNSTGRCDSEVSEVLELFTKFLTSKSVSNGSKAVIKSSAYYFMYLAEFTLIMLNIYTGKQLEVPEAPEPLWSWRDLMQTQHSSYNCEINNEFKNPLLTLLELCQQNTKAINVDIWIEWSGMDLPLAIIPHKASLTSFNDFKVKSIQSIICNIAFDIKMLFESCPNLQELLESERYAIFLVFVREVASDPDYDPDQDLSIPQLIEEIEKRDVREEKLIKFLFHSEDIFESRECVACLRNHIAKIDNEVRREKLYDFIKYVQDGIAVAEGWKELMVDAAEDLPPEELLLVIVNNLDCGLDTRLKTPNFASHLTAVFNQLAGANTVETKRSHIWLCLQSGAEVIEEAVSLAVRMSGLVPVMVQALASLRQILVDKRGTQMLMTSLKNLYTAGLSEKEGKDFTNLVKDLMAEGLLPTNEVFSVIVQPAKQMENGSSMKTLPIRLNLMKNIVDHHPASMAAGVDRVCLMVNLMCLVSGTAQLYGPTAATTLALRTDAEHILHTLSKAMLRNQDLFEKDISCLRQLTSSLSLHPRALLPVAPLLQSKGCEDCIVAKTFHSIVQTNYVPDREKQTLYQECGVDMNMSRQEWIMVLLQILPHGNELEWISGFLLTHQFLHQGKAIDTGMEVTSDILKSTLSVMHQVLYLVCKHSLGSNLDEEGVDDDIAQVSSLSIQHCFKAFSSAAMVYIQKLQKGLTPEKRLKQWSSLFRWWCRVAQGFQCHPELPALLLKALVTAVQMLVSSGKLDIMKRAEINQGKQEGSEEANNGEEMEESEGRYDELENITRVDVKNSVVMGDSQSMKEVLVAEVNPQLLDSVNCREEINQMILYLLKFVPNSQVAAATASKLKKLHELV